MWAWPSLLSPFSSAVGPPALRAHLGATRPAQREIRQGGAPSRRRLSKQPRQCPRAPLRATPTWRHHVGPPGGIAPAGRPSRPHGGAAVPPGPPRLPCPPAPRRTDSRRAAEPVPPPPPACPGAPRCVRPTAAAGSLPPFGGVRSARLLRPTTPALAHCL